MANRLFTTISKKYVTASDYAKFHNLIFCFVGNLTHTKKRTRITDFIKGFSRKTIIELHKK